MRLGISRFNWWLMALCLGYGSLSISTIASTDIIKLDWQAPLAQDHALAGWIFDSDGVVTPEDLADRMAAVRFVLIGEKHDNIDHHQLELYLLKLLLKRLSADNPNATMSITLEMLDAGQQAHIDLITEQLEQNKDLVFDTDELKSRLDWPEQGWPWDDYAAVIGWSLNRRLPLYAGNISRKTMHVIYQNGIDDRFSSARVLKASLHDALLDQVFDGHCGLMPKDSLASMVDIQLVKDAAMANTLLAGDTDSGVLIAGTGHIRKDTSVPRHLQTLSGNSMLTIALVEVDSDRQQVADYDDLFDQFDIVIFTPVANQRDYCADLEKSMHKNK